MIVSTAPSRLVSTSATRRSLSPGRYHWLHGERLMLRLRCTRQPLDAYSRVVTEVAERLAPSVANLRVSRRVRGGRGSTAAAAAS